MAKKFSRNFRRWAVFFAHATDPPNMDSAQKDVTRKGKLFSEPQGGSIFKGGYLIQQPDLLLDSHNALQDKSVSEDACFCGPERPTCGATM